MTVVYRLTESFPDAERFGLASQMRRAGISIPASIAEAAARASTRELLRFTSIAAASLSELDTLIEIARRLGYASNIDQLQTQLDDLGGQLVGLGASLKRKL